MKNTAFSLFLITALTACNTTPEQVLQGLGHIAVDINYQQQGKRLCAQQNTPALGYQCEQQAQKDLEKFHKQTVDKP